MIRGMLYRKIAVASSILLVILMLYLIPSNKEKVKAEEILEYVYPNDIEVIYLLDNNNYLSRVKMSVNNQDVLSKARDLIMGLTIGGSKKDILPNGFKAIIPIDTKILDMNLDEGVLIINFSKEFNNIKYNYEEKLIESLVYTLTSIDGVDKIEILVEGKKLTNLPNSKSVLPEHLDKSYGINKKYELTSLSLIDSYTVYYVYNYNQDSYYVPVTKYVNNENQDKVKVIIDELATSLSYESNLMSYLNSNVELLSYEVMDDKVKLNFNDLIMSDITNNVILEEVMYTVGLSLCDYLNVQDVIFLVDNQEISTFSLKTLD